MSEILLKTPCGDIRGLEQDGVRLFLGVQYAKTPAFEKPVAVTAWDGVFPATQNGADAWQYAAFLPESERDFYYREFRSDGVKRTYTGDYVTLNIVSPAHADHLPVLAFIHGGGHETGTVGEMPYGACTEYAKRDIVYVSIGYRLNVFSLIDNKNLGLHDLLCALGWLKRNVSAFGGDAARITVIGQSAGAMSITDLTYCPEAKPLMQGAILVSGGGAIPDFIGPLSEKQAKPLWDAVKKRAGAETLEQLKSVPPDVLWRIWYELHGKKELFGGSPLMALRSLHPGIDGEIIRDMPSKIVKRGEQLDVPYMIGVTSQDFMPVLLYEMALSWGIRQSRAHMRPVYGYFFDRALPGDNYKAWHAADLWYLFGGMDKCWREFEPRDYALSAQMMDYVANFVKTGDPNGQNLPAWRPLSDRQKRFRLFDGNIGCDGSKASVSPARCRRKVLNTMLFDHGPM